MKNEWTIILQWAKVNKENIRLLECSYSADALLPGSSLCNQFKYGGIWL